MTRQSNRVGRFEIAGAFFRNLHSGEGANLFHNMVVLDIQREYLRDCSTYIAIHEGFRPVEPGEIVPMYTAKFSADSIYPQWLEKKP